MTRRSDPYSWTTVRLPERDLGETILEFASPLLAKLGQARSLDEERRTLAVAVAFWNASVRASKQWARPRLKGLSELKRRLRGRDAPREDAVLFDLLTERWRAHWLDPRLVDHWSYDRDESGAPRLSCTFELPEGVRAEVSPPVEKRVAIGGTFLDEVRIRQAGGGHSFLRFPYARHSGVVGEDGSAAVYAMMPAALQLFADGRLTPVGGAPVEVALGGRALGPMVLSEVRCAGEQHDIAVLVFRPATANPIC